MYENSKIYKLQCNDGYYYIGSTCDELRKRLYYHKKDCNKAKRINAKVYKHINTIGWENVTIVLIEQFNCENKDEIRKKENEYIQKELNNPLCLNSQRAYRTEEDLKNDRKEWLEQNKDYMKEYSKQWREQNKERKKEMDKQYYLKKKQEKNNTE